MDASATRRVQFQDPRPPQAIQFLLERDLLVLLEPVAGEQQLTYRQSWRYQGIRYTVQFRLEAALTVTNDYSLSIEAHFDEYPEATHDGHRRRAAGWFDFWTRDLQPVAPAMAGDARPERYAALTAEALAAEAHLAGVPEVQQVILTALREGASFSTAHKEGGTKIRFERGEFVRADYGESCSEQRYGDERAFLAFLREFYHWKIAAGTHPEPLPDYVAWKLILRMLSPAEDRPAKGLLSRWFR